MQLIVSDCDGVLVDSERISHPVLIEMLVRAAGMAVIGFAAMTPAGRLLEAGAQQVFDRMQDLPALLGSGGHGA